MHVLVEYRIWKNGYLPLVLLSFWIIWHLKFALADLERVWLNSADAEGIANQGPVTSVIQFPTNSSRVADVWTAKG